MRCVGLVLHKSIAGLKHEWRRRLKCSLLSFFLCFRAFFLMSFNPLFSHLDTRISCSLAIQGRNSKKKILTVKLPLSSYISNRNFYKILCLGLFLWMKFPHGGRGFGSLPMYKLWCCGHRIGEEAVRAVMYSAPWWPEFHALVTIMWRPATQGTTMPRGDCRHPDEPIWILSLWWSFQPGKNSFQDDRFLVCPGDPEGQHFAGTGTNMG